MSGPSLSRRKLGLCLFRQEKDGTEYSVTVAGRPGWGSGWRVVQAWWVWPVITRRGDSEDNSRLEASCQVSSAGYSL